MTNLTTGPCVTRVAYSNSGQPNPHVFFVVVMSILNVVPKPCRSPFLPSHKDVGIHPTTRAGDSGGRTLNTTWTIIKPYLFMDIKEEVIITSPQKARFLA